MLKGAPIRFCFQLNFLGFFYLEFDDKKNSKKTVFALQSGSKADWGVPGGEEHGIAQPEV